MCISFNQWINEMTLIADQLVLIFLLRKSFLHAFIYFFTSLASLRVTFRVSLAREMRSVINILIINILRKEISRIILQTFILFDYIAHA